MRARRKIKARKYSDCESANSIECPVINNNRGFKVEQYRTEQYNNLVQFQISPPELLNSLHALSLVEAKEALHRIKLSKFKETPIAIYT